MQHVLIRKPPDPRADRRERTLDKDARHPDRSALPFARKHPRVGDVAVQTRREHKDHDPKLVTFPAKNLTGKTMPKLVQNLREKERYAQKQKVARTEELLELRKLRTKVIELDPDKQKRGKHEEKTAPQNDWMKHPANPRKELVKESVRINPLKSDRKNVGTRAKYLLTTTLLAALEELVTLIRNARDYQTALVQLTHEALDLFKRDLLRGKFRFEFLLDRFKRLRSVEILQNEIFLVLKTIIFQPDRILDDPVGSTKIIRSSGGQVGARVDRKNTLRARYKTVC